MSGGAAFGYHPSPMTWLQNYDPIGSPWLSTLVAALPVVALLGAIGLLGIRAHWAALISLVISLVVAVGVYSMPWRMGAATALYGAAFGLFPIGWLILNVMFLYHLTVYKGHFQVLRHSLAGLAPDPRVQVILVAFSFGAFVEGIAGFGAPVAITAAILIQLGFRPLEASGLSLIANTAPVAFGSLGIPITTLSQITGMDVYALSKMVGRQLPFFSLVVPFWIILAMSGWRGLRGVWPAALVAGASFALPQFLVSNFHGPWLVDVISGACSIVAVVALLKVWKPVPMPAGKGTHEGTETPPGGGGEARHDGPEPAGGESAATAAPAPPPSPADVFQAWLPWMILAALIFVWALGPTKALLNSVSNPKVEVPALHLQVKRVPPVVPPDAPPEKVTEKAVWDFNWLSATGSGILLAALLSGLLMRVPPGTMALLYWRTLLKVRWSLLTIAAMLALGHVTKYSGADATLGLALARTGAFYPFFGTLLGWLGVALTGSDTASNILFGSLQKITAEQTGISPVLMGAANSSGGVMGKMIDAQSIVVASTATNWYGHEGRILRFVFVHSIALAVLIGVWVTLQAYVWPWTAMVIK